MNKQNHSPKKTSSYAQCYPDSVVWTSVYNCPCRSRRWEKPDHFPTSKERRASFVVHRKIASQAGEFAITRRCAIPSFGSMRAVG